jgi:hypothetical protein
MSHRIYIIIKLQKLGYITKKDTATITFYIDCSCGIEKFDLEARQ